MSRARQVSRVSLGRAAETQELKAHRQAFLNERCGDGDDLFQSVASRAEADVREHEG